MYLRSNTAISTIKALLRNNGMMENGVSQVSGQTTAKDFLVRKVHGSDVARWQWPSSKKLSADHRAWPNVHLDCWRSQNGPFDILLILRYQTFNQLAWVESSCTVPLGGTFVEMAPLNEKHNLWNGFCGKASILSYITGVNKAEVPINY